MKTTGFEIKTRWSVDQAHSETGFTVRNLMIARLHGAFKKFDASIYTEAKDFTTAEIDLWIDASSATTRHELHDKLLKSVGYLDVQRNKQLTFVSITIGLADQEGIHELWGKLTIKGITHQVKLYVKFGGISNDSSGNERSGFTVMGKISRRDWGLIRNKPSVSGGSQESDEVVVSCEFELIQSDQKCLIQTM